MTHPVARSWWPQWLPGPFLGLVLLAVSTGCGRRGLDGLVPVAGQVTFAGGSCPNVGYLYFVPAAAGGGRVSCGSSAGRQCPMIRGRGARATCPPVSNRPGSPSRRAAAVNATRSTCLGMLRTAARGIAFSAGWAAAATWQPPHGNDRKPPPACGRLVWARRAAVRLPRWRQTVVVSLHHGIQYQLQAAVGEARRIGPIPAPARAPPACLVAA